MPQAVPHFCYTIKIQALEIDEEKFRVHTGCILSVGTVPTGCILTVGTVPTGCILTVETVPTGCILTVGTVPTGCILTVGTVPTDNLSLYFIFFLLLT